MLETTLVPPNATSQFGKGIDMEGNYLIVGDETEAAQAGGAYIYFREPGTGTWDAGIRIAPPTPEAGAGFGGAFNGLAISGNWAFVGAWGEDSSGLANSGAAYAFERVGTNAWAFRQRLTPPNPAAGDSFGSVSLDGKFAVVGGLNLSEAYLYELVGGTWGRISTIQAAGVAVGDWFGYPTDISQNHAIIGAHLDDQAATDAGAFYVFE
ncbi:MAG: hypothetical protein V3S29_14625 [bacterium]